MKAKVEEFEKIRYEEQLLAMQGEEQSVEKMQKLQELYTVGNLIVDINVVIPQTLNAKQKKALKAYEKQEDKGVRPW